MYVKLVCVNDTSLLIDRLSFFFSRDNDTKSNRNASGKIRVVILFFTS